MSKQRTPNRNIVPQWVLNANEETLKQLALQSKEQGQLGLSLSDATTDQVVDDLEYLASKLPQGRIKTDKARVLEVWLAEGSPKLSEDPGDPEWGRLGYYGRFGLNWEKAGVRVAVHRRDLSPLEPRLRLGEEKNDSGVRFGQDKSENKPRRTLEPKAKRGAAGLENLTPAQQAALNAVIDLSKATFDGGFRPVFQTADEYLNAVLLPAVEFVQAFFDGRELNEGTLVANQELVAGLGKLLERLDKRVECPSCEEPAIPRCELTTSPTGVFRFDHYEKGRRMRHGAKTSLNDVRLIDPVRTKSKNEEL